MKRITRQMKTVHTGMIIAAILWWVPTHAQADLFNVTGGVVVQIGDTGLSDHWQAPGIIFQCLGTTDQRVSQVRKQIQLRTLTGKVTAERFDGKHLPYIDNLVNLIVIKGANQVTQAEVMRVLVPNGVAVINGEHMTKPRTQAMDEWNHFLYDAGSNPVSRDRLVGPPKRFQWIAGPNWSKHHEAYPPTIPLLVSGGGRMFYFEEETPPCIKNVKTRWFLTARDAFNGVLLWKNEVPQWLPEVWPGTLGGGLGGGTADYKRRLIAVGNRVYVTLGQDAPVTELDAATGKTLRTLCQGAPGLELLHEAGILFVITKGGGNKGVQKITVLRLSDGKALWQAQCGSGTVVLDGKVFSRVGSDILALDVHTGSEVWRTPFTQAISKAARGTAFNRVPFPASEPLRAGAGVVIAVSSRGTVSAFCAQTGDLLWNHKNTAGYTGTRYMDVYIRQGLVWVTGTKEGKANPLRTDTLALGLDPRTGKVVKSLNSDPVWNTGHHRRCYPGKATDRFIIYSMRGAEFLNLDTGDIFLPPWTRGACGYGVMPANGLLYSPPHACRCYSEVALRGLTALAPAATQGLESRGPGLPRLETGPAYGKINPVDTAQPAGDWRTYRANNARSGKAATTVPVQVSSAWETHVGGKLTQPVIAGGILLVASADTHTVHALDAETGEQRWEFVAGARIDSSPTLHKGTAIFGCADGRVYCVRAADGELVWRFLAAPGDLRMGAYGQLESVWPVSGSVLVQNNIAYFTAGRSSYLDGGLYTYGIEADTGKILYEYRFDGPHSNAGKESGNPMPGFVMPGALPDVLVSDCDQIYMRHIKLDSKLETETDMRPNFYPARERTREEFGGDHKYWCDLYESGKRAFVGKPEWYFRSYFNNFPGVRLYSTTGLLDDSWHIRSYWSYGQIVGQQIVFDGDLGYAVRAYPNAARWAWFEAGQGYELYAGKTTSPTGRSPLYAIKDQDQLWNIKLTFRPQSMVLTHGKLFLCGAPDSADPTEALAALEGRRGATLCAVDTANGNLLSELKTASMPVFDGLIAAHERLFVAMQDGSVQCFK